MAKKRNPLQGSSRFGAKGTRTLYLLIANQSLYQMSYGPDFQLTNYCSAGKLSTITRAPVQEYLHEGYSCQVPYSSVFKEAAMNSLNTGWALFGRLLNSGWYCTPR